MKKLNRPHSSYNKVLLAIMLACLMATAAQAAQPLVPILGQIDFEGDTSLQTADGGVFSRIVGLLKWLGWLLAVVFAFMGIKEWSRGEEGKTKFIQAAMFGSFGTIAAMISGGSSAA